MQVESKGIGQDNASLRQRTQEVLAKRSQRVADVTSMPVEDVQRLVQELEIRVKERLAELDITRKQLEHYAREVIRVQEAERKRIARELHDEKKLVKAGYFDNSNLIKEKSRTLCKRT